MERVEISGSSISSPRPSALLLLFSTPNKTLLHARKVATAMSLSSQPNENKTQKKR